MNIEKLIVASDLSPKFINFWPVVSRSWQTIFGVTPTLVVVSQQEISTKLLVRLEKFGEVISLISASNAPMANQAKLARWFYAGKLSNKMVMIEDIDTVFLEGKYLREKISEYEDGKILGIGSDVNAELPEYKGKFPVSNIMGRGILFQELFQLAATDNFTEFVNSFEGMSIFDKKEDPFQDPKSFSDESLIRAVRHQNNFDKFKIVKRNVDITRYWLDRSWWPREISLDGYILVNFPRPLFENRRKAAIVINHFFPNERYPWMMAKRSALFNDESRLGYFLHRAKLFLLRRLQVLFSSR